MEFLQGKQWCLSSFIHIR